MNGDQGSHGAAGHAGAGDRHADWPAGMLPGESPAFAELLGSDLVPELRSQALVNLGKPSPQQRLSRISRARSSHSGKFEYSKPAPRALAASRSPASALSGPRAAYGLVMATSPVT